MGYVNSHKAHFAHPMRLGSMSVDEVPEAEEIFMDAGVRTSLTFRAPEWLLSGIFVRRMFCCSLTRSPTDRRSASTRGTAACSSTATAQGGATSA